MSQLFDNLSRILATPNSRRQTLRFIGSALTTAVLGSLTKRTVAQQSLCGNFGYDPKFNKCCGGTANIESLICPLTYTCCYPPNGSSSVCCRPEDTSCCGGVCCGVGLDASGNFVKPVCCISPRAPLDGSSDGITCCPPDNTCCISEYKPGQSDANCCPPDQFCNKKPQTISEVCLQNCPPDQVQCGKYCCAPGQTCDLVTNTCVATCPEYQVQCGGVCCNQGEICCTTSFGLSYCCPAGSTNCGDTYCPSGQFCDIATNSCVYSCPPGQTQCSTTCCPPGQTCNAFTGTCVTACPVQPLSPITDPLALDFEAGNNLRPDLLTPEMQTAYACFKNAVENAGGTFRLNSAYRSSAYQAHLREVWQKWNQLRKNQKPECQQLKAQVQSEFQKHGLLLSQQPAKPTGPHTQGKAIDVSIKKIGLPIETVLNLADGCGLYRPLPVQDPVHFIHK